MRSCFSRSVTGEVEPLTNDSDAIVGSPSALSSTWLVRIRPISVSIAMVRSSTRPIAFAPPKRSGWVGCTRSRLYAVNFAFTWVWIA